MVEINHLLKTPENLISSALLIVDLD
jgi:hypothetical protein